MPDTDKMNMTCLPDSGLLMAHTAITQPCIFSVAFYLAAVMAHPPKFLTMSDCTKKQLLPCQAFALPSRLVERLMRHIFWRIHEVNLPGQAFITRFRPYI